MATMQEAMEALKRADAEGNEEDARRIAQAIDKARKKQGAERREGEFKSPGSFVRGLGETAATFGSGILATPVAGGVGIFELANSLIKGSDDPLGRATKAIRAAQEANTFQPRTEVGKNILQRTSEPLQVLGEFADEVGGKTTDITGSPAAGAAVRTGIEFAPGGLGVRSRPSLRKRRADARSVEDMAREVEVDIDQKPSVQREQMVESAENMTGGRQSRGEPFPEIRQALIQAKNASQNARNALYSEAKAYNAGLPIEVATEFNPVVREALEGFDVQDMPIVQRRLKELDELNDLPAGSEVKLEQLENWRKRLNKNRPSRDDASQAAALDIIKAQYDDFIESQFNADMITGSPLAVAKWKEARQAARRYKENFKENDFIREMTRQQASPEDMRKWLFGANAIGMRKEAANTIKKLNELVGSDSPQMNALRQDALLDIMEPLLREEPNFKQFIKNYDKFVGRNKTAAEALFPNNLKALRTLRAIAKATESRDPKAANRVDLNKMGAVAAFGHGIAKSALKVNLAREGFAALRGTRNKPARRKIMSELLGYDPNQPLIPKAVAGIEGVIQTGINQPQSGSQATEQSR